MRSQCSANQETQTWARTCQPISQQRRWPVTSSAEDYDVARVCLATPLIVQSRFALMCYSLSGAPCGLRGCKNGPAPFPGRMSYKATKPGLVCLSYLSMFFIMLLFIRAPFYVLLVFIVCVLSFGCSS